MNTRNIILAVVAVVLLAAVFYALSGGETPEQYQSKIEKERERQFKYLKYNADSPLTTEQKNELIELDYYPIDQKYRVKGRMVPVENRKMLEIPLTDGNVEKYIKHSYVEFELDGKPQRLLLLQSPREPDLRKFFLAFADDTSAEETYGGGRYLDVKQEGQHTVLMDFNLAYNPYCAYNPEYACPIPPKENLLEVPVRAGEKNYIK
ncbi:DUF1684 domain-containing protein [Litoribacter ruber]|uniref:DUF1684 domain-containing protein n=1 Tax=Litoribacter ruber TaxID=702568 RepID=A0AAP2G4X7_9BACT|nr:MULTISPECIES: DUF1684 domain-containing protein [Litoribacter]MBS9524960.1 DUF1684 domain-containing protein [Litoribacter alkaliphilus]MBT0811879.1 DUF1684 domain-containing protein [Litoribacter ruber]